MFDSIGNAGAYSASNLSQSVMPGNETTLFSSSRQIDGQTLAPFYNTGNFPSAFLHQQPDENRVYIRNLPPNIPPQQQYFADQIQSDEGVQNTNSLSSMFAPQLMYHTIPGRTENFSSSSLLITSSQIPASSRPVASIFLGERYNEIFEIREILSSFERHLKLECDSFSKKHYRFGTADVRSESENLNFKFIISLKNQDSTANKEWKGTITSTWIVSFTPCTTGMFLRGEINLTNIDQTVKDLLKKIKELECSNLGKIWESYRNMFDKTLQQLFFILPIGCDC